MLTPEDRRAIEGLFDKVASVENQAPPRDADAEALIAEKTAANPAAPYYLAQTVLMQEFALKQAEERIAELEAQAARRPASGGLFGGLFGGSSPEPVRPRPRVAQEPFNNQQGGPWGRQQQGGGFLAGAAQTALGVAGGVMLGSALSGMLSPGAAQAEEPAPEDEPQESIDSGAMDDGGDMEF
jgi:hypothetical protein